MAKRNKDRTDELLAELVKGKSPEEILGEGGVLKQLTKRLVENALEGEMTEHLGYEPHAPEGKHTGNSRNAGLLTYPQSFLQHRRFEMQT